MNLLRMGHHKKRYFFILFRFICFQFVRISQNFPKSNTTKIKNLVVYKTARFKPFSTADVSET